MIGAKFARSILPDVPALNAHLARPAFERIHGRRPLPPSCVEASINDYVFDRMTRRKWTDIERQCVDKIDSKTIVNALCPNLSTIPIEDVIEVRQSLSLDQLILALKAHAGKPFVAKPAHSSGSILYLSRKNEAEDYRKLLIASKRDYFKRLRERQYHGLPKRIVIEREIPALEDYKFVCVKGIPLLCQIDRGPGGRDFRRVFQVPDFKPLNEYDGIVAPEDFSLPPQETRQAMLSHARALSRVSEYARIDFFWTGSDLYFGEITLTPGASLGRAPGEETHSVYSNILMTRIRDRAGRSEVTPENQAVALRAFDKSIG